MAAEPADTAHERRIPVGLLTGFLGAGKTSLLKRLLASPGQADSAIFINEFGAVGIDHLLVEKLDENLVLLEAGCLCCAVQGDLVRALKNLFMRALRREIPAPSQVLIETSGLADPAPVIATLRRDAFIAERFRMAGVITAVDVQFGLQQIEHHSEALRQVALADRLLITKADLGSPEQQAALRTRLTQINPAAPIATVSSLDPELDPVPLLAAKALRPLGVSRWMGLAQHGTAIGTNRHLRHDGRVSSQVLCFDAPLPWPRFSAALDALLAEHGDKVLRIKGLLDIVGDSQAAVVHCVQHLRFPLERLAQWPAQPSFDDHRSRLVLITQALPAASVRQHFGQRYGLPLLPE